MPQIELSAGTIEYTDTGGGGPVIVLLHGLLMDATLWDEVTAALSPGHRCVAPTLPLGAHRRAMKVGTDLSLPGIAKLVAEFLDRLGLDGVTLVGNDTGGAVVQLLAADGAPRVGRVVLASCDAFDNSRAAESLLAFYRPALVVWAADDRVMPPEHGRRLAGLLPDARLLEIPDSYTLIPLDQPAQLAEAIREFTSSTTIRRR